MANPWNVISCRLDAQSAHDLDLGASRRREVRVVEAVRPALVLGSMQRSLAIDAGAARSRGIDVARRHSGGGAVLVDPAAAVWIDLVVPRGDPLWDDDIGRSMHWVGQLWVSTLEALGATAQVHRGPYERSHRFPELCFASLGPGEVLSSGAKVVGISQRRTRFSARFQCLALSRPSVLGGVEVELLALAEPAQAAALLDRLGHAAPGVTPAALTTAFLAHLASL